MNKLNNSFFEKKKFQKKKKRNVRNPLYLPNKANSPLNSNSPLPTSPNKKARKTYMDSNGSFHIPNLFSNSFIRCIQK